MKPSSKANRAVSRISIDPRLDEIFAGKILFPEKLAQANEILAKYPLPNKFKKRS